MKFEEFRKKAIAILEHCQPMKASELIEATGATGSGYGWLKKMVDAGDIIKADRWNYAMPGFKSVEPKSVEVEVIEEYRPRAAMTVEKFTAKEGHLVPKTGSVVSGDTSSALSLSPKEIKKEARLERKWEKLLPNYNKSQGFKSTTNETNYVNKIGRNWTQVVNCSEMDRVTFLDLPDLTRRLIEQCSKQKWFRELDPNQRALVEDDCEQFVADSIWDLKRKNGTFCNPEFHCRSYTRDLTRRARGDANEAFGHGVKPATQLVSDARKICKLIEEKIETSGLCEAVIEELKNLLSAIKECVSVIETKTPEMVKSFSEEYDKKLLAINPPPGIKPNNLLQFLGAK